MMFLDVSDKRRAADRAQRTLLPCVEPRCCEAYIEYDRTHAPCFMSQKVYIMDYRVVSDLGARDNRYNR